MKWKNCEKKDYENEECWYNPLLEEEEAEEQNPEKVKVAKSDQLSIILTGGENAMAELKIIQQPFKIICGSTIKCLHI